jgi:hypothetical protein
MVITNYLCLDILQRRVLCNSKIDRWRSFHLFRNRVVMNMISTEFHSYFVHIVVLDDVIDAPFLL